MLSPLDHQNQQLAGAQIIGYLRLLLLQLPNANDRAISDNDESLGDLRLINQEVWLGCARTIATYNWPAKDPNWENYNPVLRKAIRGLGLVLFPTEFEAFMQACGLSSVRDQSVLPLLQSSLAYQSTAYTEPKPRNNVAPLNSLIQDNYPHNHYNGF